MTRGRSMLSVKIWKEHFKEISKKIGRFATKLLSWIRKRKQKKIFSLIQIQAGLRTCQIFQFFLRPHSSKSSTLSQKKFSTFFLWTLFLFVHFPWLSLCSYCRIWCVPPHPACGNLPHSTPARYTLCTVHTPLCRTNRNTHSCLSW